MACEVDFELQTPEAKASEAIFLGSHGLSKVLTVCFVLGCSNWLLEMLVPTPEGVILYRVPELQGTRQWFEPWIALAA